MPQKLPSAKTSAAKLPDGIEIFRAGTRTADDGSVHTITEADLVAAAAAYDPAVHEAPHTVGHPKNNAPAYGWIKRLAVQDGVLSIAESQQVEPQFAELVADGRVKKRSASFYHPNDSSNPKPGIWYVRHVAWLGAQPPAVKGLKDVHFSEDDAGGAVSFSETLTADPSTQEPLSMTEAEIKAMQEQLAAEKKARADSDAKAKAAEEKATAAEAASASFAEKAKADRKAGFVSFAEAQVKAGKLLPKDQAMTVATLEALDSATPVEFSEGDTTRKVSPSQWLQELIANAKPQVNFGEFAGGNTPGVQAGAAHGKSDAEVDKAAQAYAAQHKVDYSEALRAVTATFTSAA